MLELYSKQIQNISPMNAILSQCDQLIIKPDMARIHQRIGHRIYQRGSRYTSWRREKREKERGRKRLFDRRVFD